jgi:23S rRNA (uracil1939-C5)-methyltransferase
MTVRGVRWFGGGKSLAVDEETGETFPVARLLPGERATVVRYMRAGRRFPVADRILEASPHRSPSMCPRYEECSGCDLLHVSEAEEQAYKALTVSEVLERFADVHVAHVETVGSAQRGAHRARSRFSLRRSNGAVTLGLRGLNGTLVDIVDCPASVPEVRAAMVAVRSIVLTMPSLTLEGVEVSAGVEGVAVVFETSEWDALRGVELVDATQSTPGVTATGVREAGGKTRLLAGQWPRQLPVGDVALGPAPDAWTQPTPDRAAELYAWVLGLGLHHRKRVLDATCGTGGLSISLASLADSVVGVDANWDALKSALRSSQQLGLLNTQFRGGKIQTVASRLLSDGERFDTVVVNPMRRSLGASCMADLSALAREHVLYLAPAPRAGAEDVREVLSRGFEIRRVASVNLHPGTSKSLMAVLMSR